MEVVPEEKGGLMALEMKTRKEKDVMIISLSGSMVISDEHFEMMKLVIKEVKETKKFLVDLGKVEKIDSAGVGELVALNVAVREHDAQLRLANLDEKVGKVLQMALVHKMIPTFDTQKEALASFD